MATTIVLTPLPPIADNPAEDPACARACELFCKNILAGNDDQAFATLSVLESFAAECMDAEGVLHEQFHRAILQLWFGKHLDRLMQSKAFERLVERILSSWGPRDTERGVQTFELVNRLVCSLTHEGAYHDLQRMLIKLLVKRAEKFQPAQLGAWMLRSNVHLEIIEKLGLQRAHRGSASLLAADAARERMIPSVNVNISVRPEIVGFVRGCTTPLLALNDAMYQIEEQCECTARIEEIRTKDEAVQALTIRLIDPRGARRSFNDVRERILSKVKTQITLWCCATADCTNHNDHIFCHTP